jgi:WXG100 family type VII secretion target
MTTLKMNVPEAQSTSAAINNCVTQVQAQLNTLRGRVNSMVGSEWQSNSANQFQTEFQGWEQQLNTLLSQLTELQQRLTREIAQWEEMARQLG